MHKILLTTVLTFMSLFMALGSTACRSGERVEEIPTVANVDVTVFADTLSAAAKQTAMQAARPDSIIISLFGIYYYLSPEESYLFYDGYMAPDSGVIERLEGSSMFELASELFYNKSVPLVVDKRKSKEYIIADYPFLDITVYKDGKKDVSRPQVGAEGYTIDYSREFTALCRGIFGYKGIIRDRLLHDQILKSCQKKIHYNRTGEASYPDSIRIILTDDKGKYSFYLSHEGGYLTCRSFGNPKVYKETVSDNNLFELASALFYSKESPIIDRPEVLSDRTDTSDPWIDVTVYDKGKRDSSEVRIASELVKSGYSPSFTALSRVLMNCAQRFHDKNGNDAFIRDTAHRMWEMKADRTPTE